ncbi:PDF receptor-like [Hermetia illucens]|uniref:PDF receptor-like n=1 Tax=Hermetia illucens TaxID=343691 RepID=UPI0018CC2B54|nr:PDF receptor-like [Hermetia illucens]
MVPALSSETASPTAAIAAAIEAIDDTLNHVRIHSYNSTPLTTTTLGATTASTNASTHTTAPLANASCAAQYENYSVPKIGLYCNWTFDSILCWPPTPAGEVVYQRCPQGNGVDTTKFAERRCGLDGRWEGKSNITSPENSNGWTNYTPCFPPEVQDLLNRLYAGGNEDIVSKPFVLPLRKIISVFNFG